MLIRKSFKYEMGHIVRNAWSRRCSHSFHGHSYTAEFVFKSNYLDNGGMVCDFGFIKKYIDPFVDSFDHSSLLWDIEEDTDIINLFKSRFERVIVAPFSSTAELQAGMFFMYGVLVLQQLKKYKTYENGEQEVKLTSVRVHETTTGWAEHSCTDPVIVRRDDLHKMYISDSIKEEWPSYFKDFYNAIFVD